MTTAALRLVGERRKARAKLDPDEIANATIQEFEESADVLRYRDRLRGFVVDMLRR